MEGYYSRESTASIVTVVALAVLAACVTALRAVPDAKQQCKLTELEEHRQEADGFPVSISGSAFCTLQVSLTPALVHSLHFCFGRVRTLL